MDDALTSPSLLPSLTASAWVEEIPPEELTCQFILDEASHCGNYGRNDQKSTSDKGGQQQDHFPTKSVGTSSLGRKEMLDGSVLDDGLVVDQKDVFQEIPMTPEKVKASSGNGGRHGMTIPDQSPVQFEVIDEPESDELQVGDHVYQWRSLAGIPWVFQHHGIVMDVIRSDDGIGDDEEGKNRKRTIVKLIIADFSNVETKNQRQKGRSTTAKRTHQQQQTIEGAQESSTSADGGSTDALDDTTSTRSRKNSETRKSSSSRLSLAQQGIMRTYTDTDKWHKVRYQSSWWRRQVYRSGTCTKAKPDPVGLVLARVHFIIQHPDLLPDYHVVHANCECVAFWCKTGRWSTLQASTFLELTAAGQVKSTATLAAAAAGATQTVTVPAAGIWGWFGYTTTSQVSWLSLHPMAIPGLACYAVVSVGVPAVVYATAHKQWKKTSETLSDAFWTSATENPDVFAECITHWSDKR